MKKAVFILILVIIACIALNLRSRDTAIRTGTGYDNQNVRVTEGKIKKGDTLFKILRKSMIDPADLDDIRVAADGVYDLGKLCSGRPYRIAVDDEGRLDSLVYWADDDTYLNISREGDRLNASMENVDYTRRLIALGGTVRDNLISSLGPCKDALGLALDLSDIFAWDIDFNTDLRNGDTYRIVVEGLFLDNTLKKFGPIISAELVNNGRTYTAYRFTKNGITRYYDSGGMPLKKKFLKAPLNFRRISSYWTKRRFHPVLKRYRPHRGVDYIAQQGTPVSAIGSGSVHFAGYRAGYGKLVVINHKHKRSTYYGHLSRVEKNIRQGVIVKQGDIIGYVGSTGLATGPHLHFEMRINNMPVNPLAENILPPDRVEAQYGADFRKFVKQMNERLYEAPIGEDPPLKTAFTPGRPGGL